MNSKKILLSMISRLSVLGLCGFFVSGAWGQDKVDFVKQIKPILEKHCVSCHGGDDYEEFQIDIRDEAFNYLEAGESDESQIYEVLVSDEDSIMPPADEEHPLTQEQIALIKTWIDEGADWPDDLVLVDTSEQPEPDEATAKTSDEDNGPTPDENDNPASDSGPGETSSDNAPPEVTDTPKQEPKPEADPKTEQIFNSVGSLHPAAIHMPIGLLLAAGLFALLSIRGNFVMSDCAYYCLWLGALSAIAACATGWFFSPMEGRGSVEALADVLDMEQPVFWHRTGALVVTGFAFVLALFAASARNRDPDDGMMWKVGLMVLACGIGWVGHTGGELHYPKNHYKDLNNLYNSFFEADEAGEPAAATEPADNTD